MKCSRVVCKKAEDKLPVKAQNIRADRSIMRPGAGRYGRHDLLQKGDRYGAIAFSDLKGALPPPVLTIIKE